MLLCAKNPKRKINMDSRFRGNDDIL